jgi:hypothetical protein
LEVNGIVAAVCYPMMTDRLQDDDMLARVNPVYSVRLLLFFYWSLDARPTAS